MTGVRGFLLFLRRLTSVCLPYNTLMFIFSHSSFLFPSRFFMLELTCWWRRDMEPRISMSSGTPDSGREDGSVPFPRAREDSEEGKNCADNGEDKFLNVFGLGLLGPSLVLGEQPWILLYV